MVRYTGLEPPSNGTDSTESDKEDADQGLSGSTEEFLTSSGTRLMFLLGT